MKRLLSCAALLFFAGCDCSGVAGYRKDAGHEADDAGFNGDAGLTDAGVTDAGTDAGPTDAGETDAGEIDAGEIDAGEIDGGVRDGGADAGTPDSGMRDAGFDPALCPVGIQDGCCSLLAHGGNDPDCPSLACTQLRTSPVIDFPLAEGSWETWKGAVGLAWTGEYLMTARVVVDWVNNQKVSSLITERFSLDGGSLGVTSIPAPLAQQPGTTSLAFDPTTRLFGFAYTPPQGTLLVALDERGQQQWMASGHTLCNGIDAVVQVDAALGRFFLTGTNFTCAGSTGNPAVRGFRADSGVQLFSWSLGEGVFPNQSWESSAACDRDCEHIFTTWYQGSEGFLHGRVVDTQRTSPPDAGFSVGQNASFGGIDHTALGFDGTNFMSLVAVMNSTTNSSLLFRPWSLGTGLGTATTLSGTRALPPSIVWTGDGWLVAATTFTLSSSWAFPTDHREYSIELFHLAPDGSLRERRVFEANAYQPKLAWAGGRIAMTFTRVPPMSANETRHLVFFDCP